ncbi:hypothetical protein ACWD5V_41025, partial [Streptomyces sp. NPDC002523]
RTHPRRHERHPTTLTPSSGISKIRTPRERAVGSTRRRRQIKPTTTRQRTTRDTTPTHGTSIRQSRITRERIGIAVQQPRSIRRIRQPTRRTTPGTATRTHPRRHERHPTTLTPSSGISKIRTPRERAVGSAG